MSYVLEMLLFVVAYHAVAIVLVIYLQQRQSEH